ncbi:MAG: chromate transporter [Clostridia bacterium]|nr:chromate transporter [Clostridia bacterium]
MILFELFYVFFTTGLFTFGGGYAMLPMIQQAVSARGWMPEEQLLNFVAVSESTPGPFVVNLATYIGAEKAGVVGSAVAVFAVVLPSLIIISIISSFYKKYKDNKTVAGIMTGLRPATVGLIGAAVIRIAGNVFFPGGFALAAIPTAPFIFSTAVAAAMIYLLMKKVHPIIIIGISAVLGIAAGYCGLIQ